MSNLGAYQWMTTAAKKVGGPANLLLLAGATGAVLYKGSEIVATKCIKTILSLKQKRNDSKISDKQYRVTLCDKSNDGLDFFIGDYFRVLESDGDSVLIEKVGDENNPYFVSAKLLRKISDYKE